METEKTSTELTKTHDDGKVETWPLDQAGCTREETKSTFNPHTGNTIDNYGNIISSEKK